jgi:peroxiredoxin Q/BCP
MTLKTGDTAPNVDLKISEDRTIKLSDLHGKKVILYFYPKDNTPGCTIEAKDFRDYAKDFESLNTVIIGISRDSLKSHCSFKDKYNLNFELASDPEGIVCEQYGAWVQKSMFGKKYMGIERSTFLIGEDSKILHIWNKVTALGHAKKVLEYVKNC